MNWELFFLYFNALICFVIILRLVSFRRIKFGYTPNKWYAIASYMIIISNGTTLIRILSGRYEHADWSAVMNDLFVCLILLATKGDIRGLLPSYEGNKKN